MSDTSTCSLVIVVDHCVCTKSCYSIAILYGNGHHFVCAVIMLSLILLRIIRMNSCQKRVTYNFGKEIVSYRIQARKR